MRKRKIWKMETPEVALSPSERMILRDLVTGADLPHQTDWVALQRLRRFGYIEETAAGPHITAEGRRAIAAKPQT
jgi:hypothetical protein